MKRNSYPLIILIVFLFIAIEFTLMQVCIKTTRFFPLVKIELQMNRNEGSSNESEISKESLQNLESLLNNSSIVANQNLIVERFDKEHSFYITLITVLSILLAIFGIIPVVYGLFEKSEVQNAYNELESLKKQNNEQLRIMKIQNLLDSLQKQDNYFRMNSNILLENSRLVTTIDEFEHYLRDYFKTIFNGIDFNNFIDNVFPTLSIIVYNLMQSSLIYSNMRFKTQYNFTEKISVMNEKILYTIVSQLQAILPKEKFQQMKEYIEKMQNTFIDFTGF